MTLEIESKAQLDNEIEKINPLELRKFAKTFPNAQSSSTKEWEQWIIDDLMERFDFITLSDTKEILYYQNGVYRCGGEEIIEIESEKLDPEITSYRIKEIQNHIRRRNRVKRGDLDKDRNILNLRNGLFDLRTYELKPHSPEYYSVIQCSVPYDPTAKCPTVLHYLRTTLPDSEVEKALAFSACIITRNTSFQIAGLTVGEGNNGKSVFNNLNIAIVGKENVSSVSLQDLEVDRFSVADLFGKPLNVCGDLPSTKLIDTSIFKKIVSGDLVRAQRKFGQPFSFKPETMLLFSSNKIPKTLDQTYGFYRRWVIISFPNNFEGKEDRDLLTKLTTEQELSGYLNLLLESHKRMRDTGKFPGLESIEKREETFNKMQNSVEYFSEECIEEKNGTNVPKEDVYEAYVSYCNRNNIPKESKATFGKSFKRLDHADARPTINGNRIYVWKDLSIVKTQQKED